MIQLRGKTMDVINEISLGVKDDARPQGGGFTFLVTFKLAR